MLAAGRLVDACAQFAEWSSENGAAQQNRTALGLTELESPRACSDHCISYPWGS